MRPEITEAEAWQILAEAHDKGNTESPYLCDNLNTDFSDIANTIPFNVRSAMLARIKFNLDGQFSAYEDIDGFNASNPTAEEMQEARESRVLACLLFSEIAADEEQEPELFV